MNDYLKPLAITCLLAAAFPAIAQDTTEQPAEEEAPAAEASEADDPAAGLDMGQEVGTENGPQLYVRETSGDWEVRCVRTEETEKDPCQINQTLKAAEGNPVAEVSMFPLPENAQAAAGATIAVPLMTLLTEQLTLKIDGGAAKRYNFTWCDQEGCYARVGLSADDVAAFKRGNAATVSIVPVAAPDQRVEVPMSLTGFTAAFDSLTPN